MKVYSWKTLIGAILIGGGAFIYELIKFLKGDKFVFIYLLFWTYLIVKGLWVSLSREGFQHDMRNASISIKVMKKLFGPWVPIFSYGGYVLLIIAFIIAIFLPSLSWLSMVLFFGGFLYMILIGLYVRKHIKEEKKNYF